MRFLVWADLNNTLMTITFVSVGLRAIGSRSVLWIVSAALLLEMVAGVASSQRSPEPDLTEMSIEDLLSIEVISVGRRVQKPSQSATAVYVITQEDIRRSGVTTAGRAAPSARRASHADRWRQVGR